MGMFNSLKTYGVIQTFRVGVYTSLDCPLGPSVTTGVPLVPNDSISFHYTLHKNSETMFYLMSDNCMPKNLE